jgi:glutamate--cysteine ligase
MENLNSNDIYKPYATSLRMGDLGYISHAQDSLNISYNSIEDYCSGLKNALETPYDDYSKIGEFKEDERIQLNDSIIQIENEYYSTIRPKRVCPSGERPLNVLSNEGIDYLELRCVDLNPTSAIGITEEQIYFLDLLILFCFFEDSPEISEDESNEIFNNHKIVVNNGRKPSQSLVMGSLEVSIKDEAIRILDGMEEIAKFMDEVVTFEDGNIWMNTLEKQKNTINDYGLSLSESMLNEISNKEISFQEYGLNISKQHREEIKNISTNDLDVLIQAAKKSLIDAKEIESSQDTDFEVYLRDFLNKIS